MPEYTTTEAAELLNTNRRNVQNYAKRHGLKKFGREYIITANDIEGLKNELGKPGKKPTNVATNVAGQNESDETRHHKA
jgi:hypothetical protein